MNITEEKPAGPANPIRNSPIRNSTADGPLRPRLLPGLPVLLRKAGEVQIGTDSSHAVVITGIPESLFAALRALDGRHTTEELLVRAGPDERQALAEIITTLVRLGLIEDASCPQLPATGMPARLAADHTAWTLRVGHSGVHELVCRQNSAVVVHGSGRVATSIATLLAASGIGWVCPVADGVVQPEDTGCGYLDNDIGRPRTEAAARAVHRACPEARTDPLPPRRQPDLVVLADAVVPDPVLSVGLAGSGIPHLLVRACEGGGIVGPLVIPGRTCCLRCVDRHNTDIDPCWPALATQLAAHPQPADLVSVQTTAAFAVGQALQALNWPRDASGWHPTLANASGVVELATWNATVEVDAFRGQTGRVSWPPHPQCTCGAPAREVTQAGSNR